MSSFLEARCKCDVLRKASGVSEMALGTVFGRVLFEQVLILPRAVTLRGRMNWCYRQSDEIADLHSNQAGSLAVWMVGVAPEGVWASRWSM